LVFPAKYRRAVFDEDVDTVMKGICVEIEDRYQLKFLEIGTDEDHVHFLVQSVPTYPVTKIVSTIKSLTAREIFKRCPQFKKKLWGGEFWTDGYFASTVGRHGSENTIAKAGYALSSTCAMMNNIARICVSEHVSRVCENVSR